MRADPKASPQPSRGPQDVYEAASRLDPFQVLTAEHALLRLEVSRAIDAARIDPEGPGTRKAVDVVLKGFSLHQRREDLIMYPVCERLFGGKDGPASALRHDHAEIVRAFDELLANPARPAPGPEAALENLRRLLEAHFVKEERVLFPMMTAQLEGREAADLARRLRSPEIT